MGAGRFSKGSEDQAENQGLIFYTAMREIKHGIFSIFKPTGPTSHDMIDKLRKITGEKRIGHAGTLDPLASGVLVVGVGREATKKLMLEVKKEKEYIALIKFGGVSDTDDRQGQIKNTEENNLPGIGQIKNILEDFTGHIKQIPPVYCSVKIKGRPAHRRVRQGENIQLKAREVYIKEISIIEYQWPFLKIKAVTGPGVYIRSLARDLGERLGVGGYLYELERVRVGEFDLQSCVNIPERS